MTVPGWVDPDPGPREKPDTGDAGAEIQPASAPDPAVTGGDSLAEKPVLEWTNEDWTRWIDTADGRPLPVAPDVIVDDPDPEPEEEVAAVADSPQLDQEPSDPAPEQTQGGEASPAVEGDLAETGQWTIESTDTSPAPDDDDRTVPGPAVAEPEPAEDAGSHSWTTEADPDVDVDAVVADLDAVVADPDVDVADGADPDMVVADAERTEAEAEPISATEDDQRADTSADEAPDEDEWAGVTDHPWWKSAPVIDEPNILDPDPPTRVEAAAPVTPPPSPAAPPPVPTFPPAMAPRPPAPAPRPAPPAATYQSPPAGPATRTTRPMPASRAERAAPRPPVEPAVRSHRIRSAFGLLCVAVMVGMVVAGLITVVIFAISVALRTAVG